MNKISKKFYKKNNTYKKILSLSLFFLSLNFFLNATIVLGREYVRRCMDGNNLSNTCIFGDDYAEVAATGRNGIKTDNSCLLSNSGVRSMDWIENNQIKFLCIGHGVKEIGYDDQDYISESYTYRSLWDQGGYSSANYEGWVECDNRTGTAIERVSQLVTFQDSNTISGYVERVFLYNLNNNQLPSNCRKCGNGRTSSQDITKCPSYREQPVIPECSINLTSKTCVFGTTAGKTCADPSAQGVNKIKEGSFTYFCGAGNNPPGRVVQCDGDQTNKSYNDIFYAGYTQLKPNTNCRFYDSIGRGSSCRNKSTDQTSTSCTFGPMKVNTGIKNCAEDNNEGAYTVTEGSTTKYIYCSPNNTKVQCATPTTYSDLFQPLVYQNPDYTNTIDYTNKTDLKRANCSYMRAPQNTCNVSANLTDNAECIIPKGCYAQNNPIKVQFADKTGGLYCISTSADANKGNIYFCPIIDDLTGNPYPYTDITKITGDKVFLAASGRGNAISTSECVLYNNNSLNIQLRKLSPLSPINLIKTVSTTLYYFAIFYFIVLILINAFSYVRSGEDPSKLKQIKESIFNTVAGFIFVIASGGVIVYLINQLS